MSGDREINSNAKILSLPTPALDDLWRFRYPEEGGTKLSFEEILVWLQKEHRVESSLAGLSYALKRMRVDRRWGAAADAADAAKQRRAIENPEESLEELEAYGQFVFTNEVIEDSDRLNFARLRALTQKDRELTIRKTESAQKDRLLAQKDQVIAQNDRRLKILERKAARLEAAENALKGIQTDGNLTPEQKRAAAIAEMDKFFGLTKAKS